MYCSPFPVWATLFGPPGVIRASFTASSRVGSAPLSWLLIYRFGFYVYIWTSASLAALSSVWPHQVSVRRLAVLLHDFLHPWFITAIGLSFATLGCRYPRPDFHRLDTRHARRTMKRPVLSFLKTGLSLCIMCFSCFSGAVQLLQGSGSCPIPGRSLFPGRRYSAAPRRVRYRFWP